MITIAMVRGTQNTRVPEIFIAMVNSIRSIRNTHKLNPHTAQYVALVRCTRNTQITQILMLAGGACSHDPQPLAP